MTKQKIVIKVCMPCDRCRTKAMELVAKADGLILVAITGDEKLEVIGDGVDTARLVCHLRRKVGYAEILQVEEVKEERSPPRPPARRDPDRVVVHVNAPLQSCPGNCYCHHYHPSPPWIVCEESNDDNCAIM